MADQQQLTTQGYWEARYQRGEDSGAGSRDNLAEFKANFLNAFVAENQVHSVLEFGCGDGRQLELAHYPRYVGVDVSAAAVNMCHNRFPDDPTKSFLQYNPLAFHDHAGLLRSDLSMSLDVIYHILEDDQYELYLQHLFGSAGRYVIIYSSDREPDGSTARHVKFRKFTDDVTRLVGTSWELAGVVKNAYPAEEFPHPRGSFSDFFVYQRRLELDGSVPAEPQIRTGRRSVVRRAEGTLGRIGRKVRSLR